MLKLLSLKLPVVVQVSRYYAVDHIPPIEASQASTDERIRSARWVLCSAGLDVSCLASAASLKLLLCTHRCNAAVCSVCW